MLKKIALFAAFGLSLPHAITASNTTREQRENAQSTTSYASFTVETLAALGAIAAMMVYTTRNLSHPATPPPTPVIPDNTIITTPTGNEKAEFTYQYLAQPAFTSNLIRTVAEFHQTTSITSTLGDIQLLSTLTNLAKDTNWPTSMQAKRFHALQIWATTLHAVSLERKKFFLEEIIYPTFGRLHNNTKKWRVTEGILLATTKALLGEKQLDYLVFEGKQGTTEQANNVTAEPSFTKIPTINENIFSYSVNNALPLEFIRYLLTLGAKTSHIYLRSDNKQLPLLALVVKRKNEHAVFSDYWRNAQDDDMYSNLARDLYHQREKDYYHDMYNLFTDPTQRFNTLRHTNAFNDLTIHTKN